MYFSLIVFAAFFTFIIAEDKLIHIHAVWRHGERNPAKTFTGDLNNASAFPEGFTQLTKKGIHQLYTLGQHFQARYINEFGFLSPNYRNSEIYARSTDADRAIVSAMAFFSGLYSNQSSSDEHILAPIPVHSIPSKNDFLNVLAFECPRKDQLWKMVDKSQIIQSLLNNSHELLSEVSAKTEIALDFNEIMYVFDTAIFETYLGLPLPPWLIPRMPEFEALFVNYIAALWGFIPFKDDTFEIDLQLELSKISSGSLMAEIVHRLKEKIQCKQNINQSKECEAKNAQKFYAYSGHDITEISLLLGLGFETFIFEKHSMPSVGSSIVLELWEDEDIKNVVETKILYDYYYVKIYYYQNSSVEEPKYIGNLLPECQGKGCPLQYLIKRAELLRPKPDLESFCNQSINAATKNNNYNIFSFLFIFFIMWYFITCE